MLFFTDLQVIYRGILLYPTDARYNCFLYFLWNNPKNASFLILTFNSSMARVTLIKDIEWVNDAQWKFKPLSIKNYYIHTSKIPRPFHTQLFWKEDCFFRFGFFIHNFSVLSAHDFTVISSFQTFKLHNHFIQTRYTTRKLQGTAIKNLNIYRYRQTIIPQGVYKCLAHEKFYGYRKF